MANGKPTPPWVSYSGNNYPLRGSKGTLFEGGMRVPAFINSPLLPANMKDTETDTLFHITDWLPTILSWAGESLQFQLPSYSCPIMKQPSNYSCNNWKQSFIYPYIIGFHLVESVC